jgi:hypothetical protein
MIDLLAHGGGGAGEGGLASWQLVLIGLFYLTLASGLGIGMLIGQRNQPPPVDPDYRAPVRPLHDPDGEEAARHGAPRV